MTIESYAEIPLTVRNHLDELFTPDGVEIWWNAKNARFAGAAAREMWKTEAGRARVWQVIELLESGAVF